MHLKPVSLALFGVFLPILYLAGQNAQISGQVIDPEEQMLAYANVTLNNRIDSSLVKVDITDENGHFRMLGLAPGDYWLEITYVGLPALKETFSLTTGEKKDFEALHMPSTTGTDLEQVIVAAKRPLLELKNDKMIFNVENSINATGSNALQLLRKSPGVLIDNNDNITLLGRAGVRIFINGKPSPLRDAELASYLESLQSTDIDAIEIITNPGSKYEAEGNAGIINIRLRKDKGLGANGNLNLGYGVGIRTRYNAALSGNYRNKWMNVYGSYSFTQNYWLAKLNFDRTQYAFKYDQHNTMMGGNQPQNFKAGADFFLSKNSTLGLLVDGGFNNSNQRVRGRTTLGTVGSEIPDSILISEKTRSGDNFNINYNLNYLWQMKKDASLSIDLNYGTYVSDGTELQPNYYKDLTEQIILSQNINETVDARDISIKALKVDYEAPLAGGTFGAGIKISEVRTDNDFQFFDILEQNRVVNEDRTNNFIFEENVNAAYFNYSRKINKTVNFQVGLRAEDTRSTGRLIALKPTNNEEVKRSYLDWFPSASLNISADENNQVQLSYSRRINRPSYQALNPFQYQLDELTFHQGNPFVQPEYSNIFQVRHSFKYKLNTTLSYSRTTDMMTLQPQAGNGKVAYRTWINLAEQQDYSINIAAPTPITDWWSSFASLTAYYRKNTGDFGGENVINLEAKAFNLYTQQSFTVHKGLTLELSGFYNSPTIVQASAQASSQWSMDFGMKMQVLNGNGNLTIGLTDILKTNRWRGEIHFGALDMVVTSRWDSRRLNVNFSYFFGNRQVKKARNRKTGLDEEKKRTS